MALLWKIPRVWVTGEPTTEAKLNEVSDQLRYLYKPSYKLVTIRGTGVDKAITSTTPVAVDSSIFEVQVEVTGDRIVWCEFSGLIASNTLGAATRFDVLTSVGYVSSLTGTQLTNGLWVAAQPVVSQAYPVTFRFAIPAGILTAGLHTFNLMSWVSAGTTTVFLGSSGYAQWRVGEF